MTELARAAREHVHENETKYVAMGEAGETEVSRHDD